MRTIQRSAGGLLFLVILLVMAACQKEKRPVVTAVEKTPPITDGVYTYQTVTEDSLIWRRIHKSKGANGGSWSENYLVDIDTEALGQPCPCCPVAAGPCCKPCMDYNKTDYKNRSKIVKLDTLLTELLASVHNFERSGKVIVTCAIEVAAPSDTLEAEFDLAMTGPHSGMKQAASEATVKQLSMREGDRWVMLREEFKVDSGQATFLLSGGSPSGIGGGSVRARVMQLSYFQDLN